MRRAYHTARRKFARRCRVGYHFPKVSLRLLFALLTACFAFGDAARAMPPPDSNPKEVSDAAKGRVTSDGDEADAKLPVRAKVKECCGYPIAPKDGFRLSFYWLAYESEYANEPYDVD